MSKTDDLIIKHKGENFLNNSQFNSDLEIKDIEYDPTNKPNSLRAIEEAERSGLDVVYPKPNELQIDIDNEHSLLLFGKQLDIVKKFIGYVSHTDNPSRSGGVKRHITVVLSHEVSTIERLALQAMLGSDRVRELLGYVQYQENDPNPVLFLEKRA